MARGLRTRLGCASVRVGAEDNVEGAMRMPLCTPEEASLSADGLTLLRDAEVQRFLVDGILLVQPSSLSSAFHANIFEQLENANERGNNREHP